MASQSSSASSRRTASRRTTQKSSKDQSNHQPVTNPPANASDIKRPCRVTVTAPGWQGARTAAIAAGCSSVSDMLEKLGSGELSIIASDAISLESQTPLSLPSPTSAQSAPASATPQHIHIHPPAKFFSDDDEELFVSGTSLPKLVITGLCAAVIVGSLLYVADRIITITSGAFTDQERVEDIVTPRTGEVVAGYEVSDEYGIRAFHPVTGEPNVPHNGVDLAMDIGTPIHAVGKVGDRVNVTCWWDDGGGGWVVNQTAQSYPGYTFQSLHMSENGCKEGESKAGDAIAYSGNSGLGTGAHYDFRIKIDGDYVPPATKYLKSAVTGEPPKE
ncbi:MAG: M23 family metallopeptidase [Cyanobacteria bacterium J06560_5]